MNDLPDTLNPLCLCINLGIKILIYMQVDAHTIESFIEIAKL